MLKVMLEGMGHKVVGIAHSKEKGMELIHKGGFNMAILDINLNGGIEGVDLGRELRKTRTPFLFLTSYADRYTLEKAKEVVPGAYVLKPFTEEEVFTGLEMAMLHAEKKDENAINIKDGHRSQLLDPDDILYIKADNIYVEVFTHDRKIVSRQTLSAALEILPPDQFIRVHRSYAVNRRKIETLGRSSLQIGRVTIPISRSYRAEVRKVLDIN